MTWWPDRMETVEQRATERLLAREALWTLAVVSIIGLIFTLLGWGASIGYGVAVLAAREWARIRRNMEAEDTQ